MIPHGGPNSLSREKRTTPRVHFCAHGPTAIVRPTGADNCHWNLSSTYGTSLTKENEVYRWFWVLAGEQLSKTQ